jgi:hypothetical protein
MLLLKNNFWKIFIWDIFLINLSIPGEPFGHPVTEIFTISEESRFQCIVSLICWFWVERKSPNPESSLAFCWFSIIHNSLVSPTGIFYTQLTRRIFCVKRLKNQFGCGWWILGHELQEMPTTYGACTKLGAGWSYPRGTKEYPWDI